MQHYFITGTDTGVGKTFVTCALLHTLKAQGIAAIGMKPVAAGGDMNYSRLPRHHRFHYIFPTQPMAYAALLHVEAPTLLIVGGEDDVVIGLNEQAFAKLRCKKELEIVPGATHLFEEPGALESVAQMAADWFGEHLQSHPEATG